MPFSSQAPWAFGRLPALLARERGVTFPSRRSPALAALAGATLATLAGAAGVAFRDHATISGALLAATVIVVVSLLSQGLATRILAESMPPTKRSRLEAELAAAHAAQAELRNLAYHDDLTGLPNRSLLYDRLGGWAASSSRSAA